MTHTILLLTSRFVWFVVAGCSIWAVGCGESSKSVAPEPVGEKALGEFDQLKLKINGEDALDGKMVLPSSKRFQVSGQFRFVKPYRDRSLAPTGSIGVKFSGMKEGKYLGSRAGSDNLKFIGNRRVTFSCDIGEPLRVGDYTLTVITHDSKIIMQTKVLVEE